MLLLWNETFKQLNLQSENCALLLSEDPLASNMTRQRAAQICFEELNVPSYFAASQASLALASGDKQTGLVVDVGFQQTNVVSVYQGSTLKFSSVRPLAVGGLTLTGYMAKLLQERGYSYTNVNDLQLIKEVVEKHCFCSMNLEEDLSIAKQQQRIGSSGDVLARVEGTQLSNLPPELVTKINDTVQHNLMRRHVVLSNGDEIVIDEERFRCPELLFDPNLNGCGIGLAEVIQSAIQKSPVELREKLYKNILLCGGASQFPNLEKRLQRDVATLTGADVHVERAAQPQLAVWQGASKLVSETELAWVTRDDYEETGPSIAMWFI